MTKNRYKIILVIFGVLTSFQFAQAGELERRVFSVALNKGNFSFAKSSMYIEFPVKEYGLTAEAFLRKKSGLSSVEKAFQAYIKNQPKDDKIADVHMALHLGDLVVYFFSKKDSNGKAITGANIYEKIGKGRYQEVQGALPYHASFTFITTLRTLMEPENYPSLSRDVVKSLGPDRIQYVMPFKDKGNPKPESIPKGKRILLNLKGRPFYLNILDKSINAKFFKEYPVLAFYREYLQALSSGIKENAFRFYWEPDALKSMKRSIDSMTQEQFKNYGIDKAKDESEIRFLIDADPYYFIIFAMSKKQSLDNEIWQLARIYKTQNDGYKMYDVKLISDDLTYTFFRTDFKDRVLMPRIRGHIKKSKK